MSKSCLETHTYHGFTIEIHFDDSGADNPREWANIGQMILAPIDGYRRRTIVWENGPSTRLLDPDYDGCEGYGMSAVLKELKTDENAAIILGLDYEDHGSYGNRIRTLDDFDVDRVDGFYWCSREVIYTEYNCKRVSPRLRELVHGVMLSEVRAYEMYLNNNVYGYIIEDEVGKRVDSLWGMMDWDEHGHDNGMEYALAEAKTVVDGLLVTPEQVQHAHRALQRLEDELSGKTLFPCG